MAHQNEIDPEFYTLFKRSEELLATAQIKRDSGSVDWHELSNLYNEVSGIADKMTVMLSSRQGSAAASQVCEPTAETNARYNADVGAPLLAFDQQFQQES